MRIWNLNISAKRCHDDLVWPNIYLKLCRQIFYSTLQKLIDFMHDSDDFQFTFEVLSCKGNFEVDEDIQDGKLDHFEFPLKEFNSTLQNLLQIYSSKTSLELFQSNLSKIKNLVMKFHKKISPLLRERDLFPFFLALLDDRVKEIQITALEILAALVKEDETTIKLLVGLNAYQKFFELLTNEDPDLIKPICHIFIYSNYSSPQNFVQQIFLPTFYPAFIDFYNYLEKNGSDSCTMRNISEVFYSLFEVEMNVEYPILDAIYQNILGDLFRTEHYKPFLQFINKILDERRNNTPDYKIFLSKFYQTDFPINVVNLFHYFFNEKMDINSGEMVLCLRILLKLIKFDPDKSSEDQLFIQSHGIINEKYDSLFLQEMKYLIFGDDLSFPPSIQKKCELMPAQDREEIATQAIHFFTMLIQQFGENGVTQVSNSHILTDFLDHINEFPYKLKSLFIVLCITALANTNSEQFIALVKCENAEDSCLHSLLTNIDPLNQKQLRALDEMIYHSGEILDSDTLFEIFFPYYDFFSSLQDELDQNDPHNENVASNLSMLLGQLDREPNDVPRNDEGYLSDDDFD